MKNRFLKFNITICLIASLLTASGCATYRAVSLPTLVPEFAPYSQEQNGVTLSCKVFTKKDCKTYLGRDLIRKGFQPIHIAIKNDTKQYLLFSAQGINLPCVSPEDAASKVHTSTVGRATCWGVAGLFIWPLLIPAVVDGVGSSQANQMLDNDFASKGAKEQVIQPFSAMNGIIFIPASEFKENFTVTIFDKETREEIKFDVTAKK